MKTRSLILAALALSLGSCSAPYNGVSMFEVCAFPSPDSSTGACLYAATCTNSLAGNSFLDVATAGYDFVLPIQFNNQLASSADSTNGTVDANTAYVQSIEVQYLGANGLQPLTVPVTFTVPSGGSTTGVIPLIPVADFAKLPVTAGGFTDIVLSLKAKGVCLSQETFTTQTFQVPVTLCSGCLAGNPCPTGKTLQGVCPQLGQTASVSCQ